MNYDHFKIEKKWQKAWEKQEIFKTKYPSSRPKFYCLDMFPYPSGAGLHIGHPRGYVASDIISRWQRMRGFNVLHPMGWDAFGLPAENYALKTGIQPQISTKENITRFKKQIKALGLSYDWSREINTTDPNYYRWTQWIFIQLFKKGLAYEALLPINWCPSCQTGLANEEVISGECERCGSKVGKKEVRQWILKITQYADRLLQDLDFLDWPERIKEQQRNWIGRSEGADIIFETENGEKIKVFTTRPDTIFGATFLVLSPEHPLIEKIKGRISNWSEIDDYIKKAQEKSEIERADLTKEKTGLMIRGVRVINPANQEKIPIWVADYVLLSYGSGAIMAVPAHDQRDYHFARKHQGEIKEVILGGDITKEAYLGKGVLVNSDFFNGLDSNVAAKQIVKWLGERANFSVNYKLRDWVFSRQRYWGEPIPLVHCDQCGLVSVPENDLPVKLPKVKKYQPTGTGESPLAAVSKWVKTKCPQCSAPAKRETNTMPQWAGSCWYYLRYIDPNNNHHFVGPKKERYFMPVDLYIGGAEHAVLHLLYARFWHKFLYDLGQVSTKEPFQKLKNQGLILAEGGEKMSKSKGNTISPDELVNEYGADALRLYEMFIGPFDEAVAWNKKGIIGTRRFLEKVWRLKIRKGQGDDRLLHQTIKKVTEDLEEFKFNTAISALMILVNEWTKKGTTKDNLAVFLRILYPFAPHISEELWSSLGNKKALSGQTWPKYSSDFIQEQVITLIIQINGKVRDRIQVETGLSREKVEKLILERERIKEWLKGKKIKKVIFVPGKLMNIVIE